MTNSSPPYVPKLEALHSLTLGIALAILTTVVATILIGLFDGRILHSANQSFGLAYVLFGNSTNFTDTLKLFVLPAFVIGAIERGVLKYRLVKLAAAAGIENSIK